MRFLFLSFPLVFSIAFGAEPDSITKFREALLKAEQAHGAQSLEAATRLNELAIHLEVAECFRSFTKESYPQSHNQATLSSGAPFRSP